ncbi:rhodanese-like domain-containing protein [Demequina sp. SYSU T00b26]|uniref:Rhodanese-like domain-containing protein n=2 Tax=Demequina zhanjiangensis TaxID=3051659 RepID=A0ABT8FZ88_9MICO|nr:rhodanese-like domain-containing protein [Demequina sp. SYSU T00b26]MDN4472213.1 rhodanese-like domain-containing protein [Demequina sp. SYSU T00b26]
MADYAGDITPQQAWEMIEDGAVLVDVRTSAEWQWVGVPDTAPAGSGPIFIEWSTWPGGARNDAFVQQLQDAGITADAERPVVFLCRSGQRSIGAAIEATAAGLGPAYNIVGGFEGGPDDSGHRGQVAGWKAEGLPWRQS